MEYDLKGNNCRSNCLCVCSRLLDFGGLCSFPVHLHLNLVNSMTFWEAETTPRMLCNMNGVISHLQTEMWFVQDFHYSLYNWQKYIFCPIWNFLCENKNLKRIFSKKVLYNPLMGSYLIFKLPFPDGSYRNGVCRALWATYLLF